MAIFCKSELFVVTSRVEIMGWLASTGDLDFATIRCSRYLVRSLGLPSELSRSHATAVVSEPHSHDCSSWNDQRTITFKFHLFSFHMTQVVSLTFKFLSNFSVTVFFGLYHV